MAKKVFLSFEYKKDNWRVQTIRNIGSIESEPLLSSNEWEKVKAKGDDAIEKWINAEMKDKNCLVVLIGSTTAGRKWVKYEIKQAWDSGKGVLGIHIHNLKDKDGNQTSKGANPFETFDVDGAKLSNIVKTYDPAYATSTYVYDHIKSNINDWVDTAIDIRSKYD
jgi:hypothetical protein